MSILSLLTVDLFVWLWKPPALDEAQLEALTAAADEIFVQVSTGQGDRMAINYIRLSG